MGFIAYSYTGAAFAYRFNPLFLVYIAIFALSLAALWTSTRRIQPRRIEGTLRDGAPRAPVAAFLVLLAIGIGANELSQLVWVWAASELPSALVASEGAGNSVFVLDLGVVIPLSLLAARWFMRGRPGGALLSASLLVMAVPMGMSLLAMNIAAALGPAPLDATGAFCALLLVLGASLLVLWLLAEWPSFRPSPSLRLDEWMPRECFSDSIAVRSNASPARLLRAVDRVRPRDMPAAMLLGGLRYLPSRFSLARARRQVSLDLDAPFLDALCSGRGSVVLERSRDEVVIGTIGKLHQLGDQQLIDLRTPMEFASFDAPGHEKLAISVRAERAGGHTWLILEHRTRATTLEAERQFARYFRIIRPAGAFVSRQLLRAAVRIAEREGQVGGELQVVEHG
jgi:hypothetical protein